MLKSILRSKFAFLTTAFIISNGVNLVAIFLATLLFSNEDISLFGIWIATSTLLSLVLTLRLEQQLVGAPRREAQSLLLSAILIATIAALAIAVVIGFSPLDSFWLLLAPAAWLRALRSIADIWVIRVRMVKTNAALACVEAISRFALIVLAFSANWTNVWALALADLVAMLIYLIILLNVIPKPSNLKNNATLWRNAVRGLSPTALKNAMLNFGSAFSETLLVNMPLFFAAALLAPAQVAGIYIIQKLSESVRRLVSFTLSVTLFRSFSALRTASPATQISHYRRGLTTSFAFSAAQFLMIYALLNLAYDYFPNAWRLAADQFLIFLPFFYFFAAIGPALRLFTVRNREDLSFLSNLAATSLAIAGSLVAFALEAPIWSYGIALALAAIARAALIACLQSSLLRSKSS